MEKAFNGTVCSTRSCRKRVAGVTRQGGQPAAPRWWWLRDSINCQDADFTMGAESRSISWRTVRAHGKHTARRLTAYFAKNSSSSCVPRGFLHGGDDLVGSWIENEILARHE
jgi:hypothetical protein